MILWVATSNQHKWLEISQIWEKLGVALIIRPIYQIGFYQAPDEWGIDFKQNAFIKAQAGLNLIPAGDGVLAEDSGLVVPALGGEPGVYSARYAGLGASDEENVEKLLNRMSSLMGEDRKAYFVCVFCVLLPQKSPMFFEGQWHGQIAFKRSGQGGFGYDPIFVPSGFDVTVAELASGVKNQLSHRAQALKKVADFFKTGQGEPP